MRAALLRKGPSRWRSRQLTLALILPPTNHCAKGGFQTQTFFQWRNQVSSSAALPQNLSGFLSEARWSLWYFFRLPIRAALANLAAGLKIRFSFRIDSILAGLAGDFDW